LKATSAAVLLPTRACSWLWQDWCRCRLGQAGEGREDASRARVESMAEAWKDIWTEKMCVNVIDKTEHSRQEPNRKFEW
jgi:hypothetical protein